MQVEKLKHWFADYVGGFYTKGADEFLDKHIRLKEEHTARVCEEMRLLSDSLGLCPEDANLAQAAAVLHDVGRFEQIQTYRTYVDPKSTNHCMLGLRVIQENKVLGELDEQGRKIIEASVQWHGGKALPDGLEERTALFCKLIRDADKLDVLELLIGSFTKYYADPDNYDLEVEFVDQPHVSGHVVEALLQNHLVNYTDIQTLHDAQLVLLGWVYDINFVPALEQIVKRRYLEKIAAFLPDFPEVRQAVEHIFAYVQKRIAGKV